MATMSVGVRVRHHAPQWHQTPSSGRIIATSNDWHQQDSTVRQCSRPDTSTRNTRKKRKPRERNEDVKGPNELTDVTSAPFLPEVVVQASKVPQWKAKTSELAEFVKRQTRHNESTKPLQLSVNRL